MKRKKLIIDTDPGIDDACAILAAFNSPELEVIGLTTLFGNVRTPLATRNAIKLREMAGLAELPVAEGSLTTLEGTAKERIADFVHGSDGFGNTKQAPEEGKPVQQSAAEFIVAAASAYPGEVTLLALAPLTNVALALQLDPELPSKLAQLVILGGAFFMNGNVNPAAEANFFGDPEAADAVFGGAGDNTWVVGLDVTHRCVLTASDLKAMFGQGRFGSFLSAITEFYLGYHKDSYKMDGVYMHDPLALAAVLEPTLFDWREGAVRVLTDGIARGASLMDAGAKNWNGVNAWMGRPKVKVAIAVESTAASKLMLDRMTA